VVMLIWRSEIQLHDACTVVKVTGISLQVFTVHVVPMYGLLVLLVQLWLLLAQALHIMYRMFITYM